MLARYQESTIYCKINVKQIPPTATLATSVVPYRPKYYIATAITPVATGMTLAIQVTKS